MTENRGSGPVMAVILMIVITLLITSIISYQLSAFGSGLDEKERQLDASYSTLSGNPWSGEPGDLVRVSNNKAGATNVRYRLNFTFMPGSPSIGKNLNNVYFEVTTGSPDMFSNTDLSDLISAGVDVDSDGSIDEDMANQVDQWEIRNGGSGLKVNFPSSGYTVSEGDSVIIVFGSVDNPPDPGDYQLRAETNNDGNWHNATITFVE